MHEQAILLNVLKAFAKPADNVGDSMHLRIRLWGMTFYGAIKSFIL